MGGCVVTFDLMGNDTICANSAVYGFTSGEPVGGTFSGPGVMGEVFDPAAVGPGEYTITYSYSDANCTGSASVVLTVLPAEVLGFIGNFNICAGETTVISSNNGLQYTWANGAKTVSQSFTPAETMTSYANGLTPSGCNVTTPFTITVGALPPVSITGATSICPGDTTYLTIEGADSWQWSTGSNQQTIQVITSTDLNIGVTVYGTGCQLTINTLVQVLPIPDLVVESESFVCIGDTVHLTATGAATYKSFNGFFDGYMEFVPLLDVMITVFGYNEIGCAATVFIPIDVRERPTISLAGVSPVCEGNGLTLNADGADTYEWMNIDNNELIASGDDPDLYFLPETTTNYVLAGYNSLNCPDTIQFTLIVHPLPELEISEPMPICIGSQAQLQASGAPTYLWNNTSSANPFVFTAQAMQDITLTGISAFGCTSSTVYTATGYPIPDVLILGSSVICDGVSTTLQAFGASSYVWQSTFPGNEFVVSPSTDSLFVVTGTTDFGCVASSSILIHVNNTPTLSITGVAEICAGQLVQLVAETNGVLSWGNGQTGTTLDIYPMTDTLIYVASTSVNGCVSEDSLMINVGELPVVTIEGDDNLCFGESSILTANGALQYTWSNGATEQSVTVSPLVNTNFTVIGTGSNGCNGVAGLMLEVLPKPYVYFNFSADTVCNAGSTFSWISNPVGGIFSGSAIVENQFSPNTAPFGINDVTYSFTNQFGCSSSSTDQIVVLNCTGTGLDESGIAELVVYPNPTNDILNISCQCQDVHTITLINSVGQVVLIENVLSGITFRTLNISDISPGLYDLILRNNNNQILHQKILKQ